MADPPACSASCCASSACATRRALERAELERRRRSSEVYPWGTIRAATPRANGATAAELEREEIEQIGALAWQYLELFCYADFMASVSA